MRPESARVKGFTISSSAVSRLEALNRSEARGPASHEFGWWGEPHQREAQVGESGRG